MSFLPRLKAVALDVVAALINPHQTVQCERQFGRYRDVGGKLAVSTVRPRGDAPISKACRLWPLRLAFVRPAHQLEGRFDVPPRFGVSLSPCCSRARAFCAASAMALSPCASNNCRA